MEPALRWEDWRDIFAAAAVAGLLARPPAKGEKPLSDEKLADRAYQIAEELVLRRQDRLDDEEEEREAERAQRDAIARKEAKKREKARAAAEANEREAYERQRAYERRVEAEADPQGRAWMEARRKQIIADQLADRATKIIQEGRVREAISESDARQSQEEPESK